MESYEVIFSHKAAKAFEGFARSLQERMVSKIDALAIEPRPPGCEKLTSFKNAYRVRVGDYRIVYAVDDLQGVVSIDRIAHRRDVYRRA